MSVSVSILIPCYNAARWVGPAIESALAQTYPRTEVVVYDDGSSDASLDVIRGFGERVRWGTGPNRGGGPARNWLLAEARGAWIQYLDADDLLEPSKIEGQVEALAARFASGKDGDVGGEGSGEGDGGSVDVLYGPVTFQYHEAHGVARRHAAPVQYPDDPWASLVTWDLPQTGSPLWRTAALRSVGGWKDDQPVCQEHELYLRLLMVGARFAYDPAGGAVYRQWSDATVCRKDVPNTYRHRLAITRRAEAFMREQGLLTPARRAALDRAYLACARIIWTFDRPWAASIMQHVDAVHAGRFEPPSNQVPAAYRWLYRAVGFAGAERVAAWKRAIPRVAMRSQG